MKIVQLLLVVVLYSCSAPKYKIGECAKDQLLEQIRKIEKVDKFKYEYALFHQPTKKYIKPLFFMRIRDFDRIMIKVECPKEEK